MFEESQDEHVELEESLLSDNIQFEDINQQFESDVLPTIDNQSSLIPGIIGGLPSNEPLSNKLIQEKTNPIRLVRGKHSLTVTMSRTKHRTSLQRTNSRNSHRNLHRRFSTIACEKHTLLHARCPSNCCDRRPAKPRLKKRKSEKEKQKIENQKIDNQKIENQKIENQIDQVHEPSSVEQDINISLQSQPDSIEDSINFEGKPSFQSRRTKIKSKANSPRKYLPSACERHKGLHTRCPSNCMDRLKRDSLSEIFPEEELQPLENNFL